MNKESLENRYQVPKIVFRGQKSEELFGALIGGLGVSPITAQVLANRGVRSLEEGQVFLNPSLKTGLREPLEIKNMERATELLKGAIEGKKLITVYTDFDVDGITSGSQLYLFLKQVGALVNRYTPNRFHEGYGLQKAAVEKLAAAKTGLLVTVDCGISSISAIELAKSLGMEVLVVDHHKPLETLPNADIIVDPEQIGCPFGEYKLCAAGLVWMLIIAMRRALANSDKQFEIPDPKSFLDLAAIGTICDMVPLNKLNRVIASRGLEAVRTSKRPGLQALLAVSKAGAKKRLTGAHISFGLGPRINAAGRLEDAKEVFELLTTKDEKQASTIAKKLDRLNTERREIEVRMKKHCIEQVYSSKELLYSPALCLYDKSFHQGVIGIVAQRLVEEFYRPSTVMAPATVQVNGREVPAIKGSVRSIKGFNVAEVLEELGPILISGGGHEKAGGFCFRENYLQEFSSAFVEAANKRLKPEDLTRPLNVDLKVELKDVDFNLVEELNKLSPFGYGNPTPVLMTENVKIESVSALGSEHIKAKVSDGSYHLTALGWGFKGNELFKKDTRVNLAFSPEINSYNGLSSVQLNIKEIWV